ncbi:PLP-dependent transferase [Methylovirgula sp. 4M-Z18]|uniref:PLP-dependent transferase n=1 Tax=Methylovirgula sp. 4M-Z18 TaxID=2293567 RepID=UPI000E2E7283|nr:PLP-dependent transferase [Methylovirgula sp. 4M-Z18]RFB78347.1 aminotransferase class I/II-fold pyridoxal phosphate-dependent enzyme [Methylovirgula sp. 4M-Z18]
MIDSTSSFDRAALIVAHDEANAFDAVVPPIVQTSLFTFSSYEEMEQTYLGAKVRPAYTRGLNPTVRHFETMLAQLEQAEDAMGFASGMAAISSTVMALVQPGDRIVCVRHVYPDAYRLFQNLLKRYGVTVTYVDIRDEEAVAAALPGAKLLYLESPTSWMMHVGDLAALAALAKKHGIVSVIDNSWATPIFQRPLTYGIDLVVHSASKYISGHSDVVAGVVAGSKELIARIKANTYPYLGGKLSPFDAWLLIRGLRTLPYRMKAHEEAGLSVARRLAAHPQVTAVHHPGLGNTLPASLSGTSSLFSFELKEGVNIPRFVNHLRLFKLGVSWGGHESLVVPSQVARAQNAGPNSAIDFEVPPSNVRLHVGLEGSDALWSDLTQAIAAAS